MRTPKKNVVPRKQMMKGKEMALEWMEKLRKAGGLEESSMIADVHALFNAWIAWLKGGSHREKKKAEKSSSMERETQAGKKRLYAMLRRGNL